MPIEIEIEKVASLARIALSSAELKMYGTQLDLILSHAERVQQLDTEGVPPTSHPVPTTNALRPDLVTGSLPVADVLACAPEAEGPYFKVPPVLGPNE